MEVTTVQIVLFVVAMVVIINIGAVIAIWWDKRRATRGEWRLKEATLLVWALFGGWPGGIWAMRQFRHKTSKGSFIAKYVFVIALNIGVIVAITFVAIG